MKAIAEDLKNIAEDHDVTLFELYECLWELVLQEHFADESIDLIQKEI